MKTKKQIYGELSDEIVENRKSGRKIIQTGWLLVIAVIVMAIIVRISNNEDEEFVFCVLIIIAGVVIYRKLPFGKVEDPTYEEIIECCTKKYDDAIIKQVELNVEIEELSVLIKNE